jgi:multicomponent Na+:H+ antiporter subunit E
MARWLGGIVLGGLLWGLWVLFWRGAGWPVVALGSVFPAAILVAVRSGVLRLEFPVAAWIRADLWVAFIVVVTMLVVQAVAHTGWAIITGRIRPGIVAIPVDLNSEMGQLLLLWAITVTPGTIALLVEGNMAYVHCLHRPTSPHLPGIPTVANLLKRLWG